MIIEEKYEKEEKAKRKVDYRAEITLRKIKWLITHISFKKAEKDRNKKGGKKDNKGEP